MKTVDWTLPFQAWALMLLCDALAAVTATPALAVGYPFALVITVGVAVALRLRERRG